VQCSQQKHNLELKESWYEKLHRWEDALKAYDAKQLEDPLNFELTLGRMRCLNALGDWERLSQLSQEKWLGASEEQRRVIAPLGAAAAWGLWQWELLDDYITIMKEDTPDGAFFRSVLSSFVLFCSVLFSSSNVFFLSFFHSVFVERFWLCIGTNSHGPTNLLTKPEICWTLS